jgi:hypothetical protein
MKVKFKKNIHPDKPNAWVSVNVFTFENQISSGVRNLNILLKEKSIPAKIEKFIPKQGWRKPVHAIVLELEEADEAVFLFHLGQGIEI